MDELEDLLQRYRPSGPTPELRERVLLPKGSEHDRGGSARYSGSRRRFREWLIPMAAAAAAIVFYALTDSVQRRLIGVTSADDKVRETAVSEMAEILGGDEYARVQAEQMMKTLEALPRIDAPVANPGGITP